RLVDLRVDDSKNPYVELRRLLNIFYAGEMITQANAKVTAGDLAGGLKIAKEAVAKSPEYDNAYVALANINLKMNQKSDAMDALRKAVELNPGNKRQLPKNQNFKDILNDPDFKRIVGF